MKTIDVPYWRWDESASCPNCEAWLTLEEDEKESKGNFLAVKCPKCNHVFTFKKKISLTKEQIDYIRNGYYQHLYETLPQVSNNNLIPEIIRQDYFDWLVDVVKYNITAERERRLKE